MGRSPGGGHGNPLQYSCLEKHMARGAWRATVHSVAKSETQVKQLSMHAQLTYRASLMAQMVKNLPAMQETQVRSLGWVDPRIRKCLPIQYSCLENSMDVGAWWATVHGVAKSCT